MNKKIEVLFLLRLAELNEVVMSNDWAKFLSRLDEKAISIFISIESIWKHGEELKTVHKCQRNHSVDMNQTKRSLSEGWFSNAECSISNTCKNLFQ